MKQVLLACSTMKEEIEWVLKHKTCIFDRILWVRSGMHNVTDNLRAELISKLSEIEGADRVILGFGACGNALIGITAGDFELIIPKVDDCISIMLGSYERKQEIRECGETYFLTRGWLDGESNIYKEYLFSVEKYGKEMADMVYRDILGAYVNLGVIDTEAYDYELFVKESEVIAQDLQLKELRIKGDLSYLERLLCGPWDCDRFIHISPHQTITIEMFL